MNGIIFYLRIDLDIANGHITILDSQFALTIISQTQYWDDFHAGQPLPKFKGEQVKTVLSAIISDWDAKGLLLPDLTLKEMSATQVKREIWEQLKSCVIVGNNGGCVKLKDADCFLPLTFLDDSLIASPTGRLFNMEPLLVNTVVSHSLRPDAHTRVRNLFLAADYVKTNSDLADMDTANEAARRATNAILALENFPKRKFSKTASYSLPSPLGLFSMSRLMDQENFKHGLPWQRPKFLYWFSQSLFWISSKIIKLPPIILFFFILVGVIFLTVSVLANYCIVILWRIFRALKPY